MAKIGYFNPKSAKYFAQSRIFFDRAFLKRTEKSGAILKHIFERHPMPHAIYLPNYIGIWNLSLYYHHEICQMKFWFPLKHVNDTKGPKLVNLCVFENWSFYSNKRSMEIIISGEDQSRMMY
jgi:hypothetical protein